MTGRRRPPRSGRGRAGLHGGIAKPKGFEDVPEMTPEEVERRVDVRGGGEPREPIIRPPRRVPPERKPERTIARDALLLIGLAVVGLVALSFLLPNGPLTSSSTTPPGTQAAVASVGPTAAPITPPGASPTTLVVVDPSLLPSDAPTAAPSIAPTAAPPTPTLKPGQTPRPTPKPTPKPTPVVTPKPTPPPGSPTMTVIVNVVNDDGGTATPSSWLFSLFGANASPSSFAGSASGTLVTMAAGVAYQIDDTAQDAEGQFYTAIQSSHCGSGTGGLLVNGQHVTCTITKYDQPVSVKVFTHVNGGSNTAADWAVSVTASGATPSGTVAGSETGVTFKFRAHAAFDVNQVAPAGYDPPTVTGSCSDGSGFVPGTHLTCTFTFDATPEPTAVWPFLPFALPLALRRRWRPIRRR